MPKYRKKPVVVEAIQWMGINLEEIRDFVGNSLIEDYNELQTFKGERIKFLDGIEIRTLEGNHRVLINDYIIKGVQGEFYPCKPDIFLATYEEVENGNLD